MADSYEIIGEELDYAKSLLTGDRAKEYGDPTDAHQVIADFWSVYLKRTVTPQDVAILLALMKIARLSQNPRHGDSIVDSIAYMAIAKAHQVKAEKESDS